MRALACILISLAIAGGCDDSKPSTGDLDALDAFPVGDTPGDITNNAKPGPMAAHIEPAEPVATDDLTIVVDDEPVDPDGGPEPVSVVVHWFKDGVETTHGALVLPAAITARGEVWRAEVHGFDGAGEGPGSVSEVTIGNSPPKVDSLSLTPGTPGIDDVLVCSPGLKSDPDGDDVSLTFRWFLDDQLVPDANTGALQPPLKAGGKYQCSAIPFDGAIEGEEIGSNIVNVDATAASEALIGFSPKSLDLGTVQPLQTSEKPFTVLNVGDGPLEITGWTLEGDDGFSAEFTTPVTLQPEETAGGTVTFTTQIPGLHKATMLFETNAKNPQAAQLPLLGIGAAPCLSVDPKWIDFGGAYPPASVKKKVTLKSCGAQPLTIESIALVGPADAPYEVDMAPLPSSLPLVVAPNDEVFVNVEFSPVDASPTDEQGIPIPEEAKLSISTNAPSPVTDVPLSGFAVAEGCPVPIIDVLEGPKVGPDTLLHLSAAKSFGAFGTPSIISWGVKSTPPGVPLETLLPAADAVDVTYQTAAPGNYVFNLQVYDEANNQGQPCGEPGNPCTQLIPGCQIGELTVVVSEETPLEIELVWDTPGDANQNDTGAGQGADLDLHLANHAEADGEGEDYDGDGAPDSWFDIVADCFWLDTSPDWGEPGDTNDPELVAEDADGKGPERIAVAQPETGGSFTIGVHYWSAFEYGPSVATVRVYHFGELIWQVTDVVLNHADLWEVATITWPSADIVEAVGEGGGPKITPEYPNPFFQ